MAMDEHAQDTSGDLRTHGGRGLAGRSWRLVGWALAPTALAVCLGGAVVLGPATASAPVSSAVVVPASVTVQDPPAGSPACTDLVDHSSTVENARAGVDWARQGDHVAGTRAVQAGRELAAAQVALTKVHPGEPGYAGARERYEEAKAAAARAGAAKDKADQAVRDAQRGVDRARVRAQQQLCSPANGSGGITTGPSNGDGGHGGGDGPSGTDPLTGSDGSTATTSGTQVTEVPQGAAQTGEA